LVLWKQTVGWKEVCRKFVTECQVINIYGKGGKQAWVEGEVGLRWYNETPDHTSLGALKNGQH
jgi:hypothetical protein